MREVERQAIETFGSLNVVAAEDGFVLEIPDTRGGDEGFDRSSDGSVDGDATLALDLEDLTLEEYEKTFTKIPNVLVGPPGST